MIPVSLYPSAFDKNAQIASADDIAKCIVEGVWEGDINYVRSLGKKEYDAEKKKLMCVTWSGTFKPGDRSIKTIASYSQLVCLDVDKMDKLDVYPLVKSLHADKYVRYAFVSPSETGIKAIFKVNTGLENHLAAYLALKDYFEKKYSVKVDKSGKDVSRLCFISSDRTGVMNVAAEEFFVEQKYIELATVPERSMEASEVVDANIVQKTFEVCVKMVERNMTYQEGERNNYIHALACCLNRFGVRQDDALKLIGNNYSGLEPREVFTTVRSAYFHNQHEFNTKTLNDAGETFTAPPYIANFTDDVVINDVMKTTATLFHSKVPRPEIEHIIQKLVSYYELKGYIDPNKAKPVDILSMSEKVLMQNYATEAEKKALLIETEADLVMGVVKNNGSSDAIPTGLPTFDLEMFGGLTPGLSIGVIGMGESFKSMFVQRLSYNCAVNDIACLYLNGEMSKMQWLERGVQMSTGINLKDALRRGKENPDDLSALSEYTVESFTEHYQKTTKGNIFVVSSGSWTKESVLATIDQIYYKYGKKVRVVIGDGLSQYDWGKLDEINAAIKNSMMIKEIAKEAHNGEGVACITLVHISGDIKRHFRDTGKYVRGGKKVLANFDGYFCTSRLIDEQKTNSSINEDEVEYIPSRFYLRYVDKRSSTGQVNKIISVLDNLSLYEEPTDPATVEVRINKSKVSNF